MMPSARGDGALTVPGVQVAWVDLGSFSDLERFFGLLDPAERARAARHRPGMSRDAFVAAHGLLREELARRGEAPLARVGYAACTRCGGDHGRPVVEGGSAEFEVSISHSGHLVAVATSTRGRVGVDVETIRERRAVGTLLRLLHPVEVADVTSYPSAEQHDSLVQLWTRKEAYAKARGSGLCLPLAGYCLAAGQPTRWPVGWTILEVDLPGGVLAVCFLESADGASVRGIGA